MKSGSFVMAVFALFGTALGAWSEPEKISDEDGGILTIDNHGVCWCGTESAFYSNPGETTGWQFETEPPFWGYPCFDRGDTLWIVMHTGGSLIYSRYDGKGWSEIDTIPAFDDNKFPRVTADSANGIWVGWSFNWRMCAPIPAFNRYQDGVWDTAQMILDGVYSLWSLTTDALGHVWAGMNYASVTRNDSSGWNEAKKLDEDGVLNLAPDRFGGVWAIWSFWFSSAPDHDTALIKASYWDGETWSSPDTIGVTVESSYSGIWPFPAMIAVDTADNAWAVWRQTFGPGDSYGDIYYSVNAGPGWSEPAPVNEHPALDENPYIAADRKGRVWCMWVSDRGGEEAVWASYTWGAGVEEDVTPATHQPPILTVDRSVGREFTFFISSPVVSGKLEICDACGRLVKQLAVGNDQTVFWDGRDDAGKRLSPGVYFVRIADRRSSPTRILASPRSKIIMIR
ncbi:hypothetical protein JXM67_07070 [candidate division WOR-3 bacterium]|nr:hypothetical protein [candidate division WOR-3 bacterium]